MGPPLVYTVDAIFTDRSDGAKSKFSVASGAIYEVPVEGAMRASENIFFGGGEGTGGES